MARFSVAAAAVAGCLATAEALSLNTLGSKQLLSLSLRPDAAAEALSPVEEEWGQQVTLYSDCVAQQEQLNNTDAAAACEAAPAAFGQSCDKVVSAVVQGSSGDKEKVHEYFDDVCSQHALTGWKQGYCRWFSQTMTEAMTDDSYTNRDTPKVRQMCEKFWQRILKEDKLQVREPERLAARPATPYAHAEPEAEVVPASHSVSPQEEAPAATPSGYAKKLDTAKTIEHEIAPASAPAEIVANTTVVNASRAPVTLPASAVDAPTPLAEKNMTKATK
eukprot:TRINITY_DN77837_c0_g1_i1.p1 TRINITY_DN77837_c0_g1~~TRINITY_DN77837_c0_g1_i1.p1  ORF type:complete len:276 (+),score=77.51 TRINITY_DN77837_c0_g1_i1:62-889(+)